RYPVLRRRLCKAVLRPVAGGRRTGSWPSHVPVAHARVPLEQLHLLQPADGLSPAPCPLRLPDHRSLRSYPRPPPTTRRTAVQRRGCFKVPTSLELVVPGEAVAADQSARGSRPPAAGNV